MKRSRAPRASASPNASERKIVLRAGTYVIGIEPSTPSLGTSISAVSAEPPNALKLMGNTICEHAPSAFAIRRSEEHTSELQSLMRISYAVFCLKKKKNKQTHNNHTQLQYTHLQ